MWDKNISVYSRLGVTPIINGRGCLTIHGGKIMSQTVIASMLEASRSSVFFDDLIKKACNELARITGADGAFISSGAASGLFIAGAACLTGKQTEAIAILPTVKSAKNQFVIPVIDRHYYVHQAFRAAGGILVEIGTNITVSTKDYLDAITPHTAALVFFYGQQSKEELRELIQVGQHYSVPVVVDSAAQIPPKSNLTDLVRMGADLVIYSGGKGIGGPQCTGLVLGKKELIEACVLNGSPNSAIGRSMKVGKEEVIGLLTAVEELMSSDEDALLEEWISWCDIIVDGANGRSGIFAKTILPYSLTHNERPGHSPASPIVEIDFSNSVFDAEYVKSRLENGSPPIMVSTGPEETVAVGEKNHTIILGPSALQNGEAEVISVALGQILTVR